MELKSGGGVRVSQGKGRLTGVGGKGVNKKRAGGYA